MNESIISDEEADVVVSDSMRIAKEIIEGRTAHDALCIVTTVSCMVFRALIDPDHYNEVVETYTRVMQKAPVDAPFTVSGEKPPDKMN